MDHMQGEQMNELTGELRFRSATGVASRRPVARAAIKSSADA